MQYVYRKSEPGLWTVGHYDPVLGTWHPESDHESVKSAVDRVQELNGGPGDSDQVLLDKFATAALTGLLASYSFDDSTMPSPKDAARLAYDYAAAMLAERNERDEYGNVYVRVSPEGDSPTHCDHGLRKGDFCSACEQRRLG